MNAFLPTLLAAFTAEWGDRTQLLVMMLALRFRGNPRIIVGIGLAALANGLVSAYAGRYIEGLIGFRAINLMLALALISASVGAFLPQKPPKLGNLGGENIILASFLGFGILAFGDKTQFLTMTLAARSSSFLVAAIGAAAGVTLANVAPVLLGDRLPALLPLRLIRLGAGALLLFTGVFAGVNALQLI